MNKFLVSILLYVCIACTAFTTNASELADITKVTTVTNCIHDKFFKVSKAFMENNGLKTDGTYLIDAEEANRLSALALSTDYQEIHNEAGGSTANSLVTLKNLGFDVTVMGTLANDDLAQLYTNSLTKKGVNYRLV